MGYIHFSIKKKKIKNSIIVVFVTVVAVVAFAVIVVVVVVSSVHWASLDALECILYFPPGMIGNSLLLFRTSLYIQSSRKNLDSRVWVCTK